MTHEEHLERQVIVAVKGIEGLRKLLLAAEAKADAAEARAAQAERQVHVLAAKLSDVCGAGPCDSTDGWWPCPLVKLADGSDCTNDEGGCCWVAWSSAQAAQEGGCGE